ncbi:hypothetical protein Bca52824_067538 [Brassica carinata]|uniref:Uncharacterized protein n=1 Tax=Brassica carinata TaxID=52824 RepID=A0A8X7QNJ3_BRACI|nr:hypothetical protein Bca52824_067538 [Brassica carinata]
MPTFDNGMGTADPPDLPLSPTKVGSSLGEAQGSDRLVKNGGDFTEVLDVTKSLGIKDSEMVPVQVRRQSVLETAATGRGDNDRTCCNLGITRQLFRSIGIGGA